jgi:hypothetical protein
LFTYEDFAEGRAGGTYEEGAKGAARLCCAPLRFGSQLRFKDYHVPISIGDAMQDFISRVLNTRVGLVELPRRLGSQLAQSVTVAQSMDCLEYQFRPHRYMSPVCMNECSGARQRGNDFSWRMNSGIWEPNSSRNATGATNLDAHRMLSAR